MTKSPKYKSKLQPILDALTPGERMCALTGRAWNMTQQEIDGYRRFGLPPSRYHPETRWMILNQFGTGYQWWWNRHWKTGEPLLSFHHPASGFRVLPEKEWFDMDFANNKVDIVVLAAGKGKDKNAMKDAFIIAGMQIVGNHAPEALDYAGKIIAASRATGRCSLPCKFTKSLYNIVEASPWAAPAKPAPSRNLGQDWGIYHGTQKSWRQLTQRPG